MEPVLQEANRQHQVMLDFGRKQAALFEKDNISYTDSLLILSGSRRMMVWLYCVLKNYKYLVPIEDLDLDVKQKMWLTVKDICSGRLDDKGKAVEMCKAFYALEYFLNEYNT
jgi:hypothetical protein